jgi:hypothetical protein
MTFALALVRMAAAAPVSVDVQAMTVAPLDIGGRVTVEGPFRLRASTEIGALPPAYLDLINTICVSAGCYDETTASLISATLDGAVVWRTHLGWRPWAKHGCFFTAGYGLLALGGGLTGEEALEAATGRAPAFADGHIGFDAAATTHMVDGTLGWEWAVKRHFLIRAEAGMAFTVAADVHVTPQQSTGFPRIDDALGALGDEAADYLHDEIVGYVHTPTVGLGVGWRF